MEKQEKYSVEVTESGVSVVMHPEKEQKLTPQNFETAPVSVPAAGEMAFYGAFNEQGAMERCVSSHIGDRKVVAALVGNWVAEGYNVQRMARKEMVKQLRKIDAAAKEEADRVISQAATPAAAAPSTPAPPEAASPSVETVAANDPAPVQQSGTESPSSREDAQAAYLAGQEGGAGSTVTQPAESSNHSLPI